MHSFWCSGRFHQLRRRSQGWCKFVCTQPSGKGTFLVAELGPGRWSFQAFHPFRDTYWFWSVGNYFFALVCLGLHVYFFLSFFFFLPTVPISRTLFTMATLSLVPLTLLSILSPLPFHTSIAAFLCPPPPASLSLFPSAGFVKGGFISGPEWCRSSGSVDNGPIIRGKQRPWMRNKDLCFRGPHSAPHTTASTASAGPLCVCVCVCVSWDFCIMDPPLLHWLGLQLSPLHAAFFAAMKSLLVQKSLPPAQPHRHKYHTLVFLARPVRWTRAKRQPDNTRTRHEPRLGETC